MNYIKTEPCALSRKVTMALLLMLAVVSCKKEKDEQNEKPVFGTCAAATPTGRFSIETDGKFVYRTSGGGKLIIDHTLTMNVTHKDYPAFFMDFWGEVPGGAASYNHENLNGKHVKDRVGNVRTLVFPDGAKVTWYTASEKGSAISMTIYDHGEVHHINPGCNTLEYGVINNPAMEKELDDDEPNGETASFEFTATGLLYFNIYQEDTRGQKVMKKVPIGEIYKNEPNRVNDYW